MEPPGGDSPREAPAVGGFGGSPTGPLVLPGTYSIAIEVAGAPRTLKGELRVDGDPRVSFADADRRARQATLMKLYQLQKSLASARASSSTARAGADTRVAQLQSEVTAELNTATNLSRAIEGYSGLPTTDQKRQVDWVTEDARKTLEALGRALQTQ